MLIVSALMLRYRYGWMFIGGPEYRASFPEVTGLVQGDLVRYAGLGVGRVRRVEIDPADPRLVLVTFRVRDDTPVLTSTRAVVVSAGGRPASFVNLRPGDPNAARATPGSRLRVEEGPTLQQTLERVAAVLDRTDTLLAAAHPLVTSDFFPRLARTTANVDTLIGVAARGVDRWGPRLEATVRRAEQVLERTDRVLAVLDSARPALAQAPGEMVAALQETRALLAGVRTGVAEGGGLQTMMRDLTLASDNLARLSTRPESNPVSVLQRRRPAKKIAGPAIHD